MHRPRAHEGRMGTSHCTTPAGHESACSSVSTALKTSSEKRSSSARVREPEHVAPSEPDALDAVEEPTAQAQQHEADTIGEARPGPKPRARRGGARGRRRAGRRLRECSRHTEGPSFLSRRERHGSANAAVRFGVGLPSEHIERFAALFASTRRVTTFAGSFSCSILPACTVGCVSSEELVARDRRGGGAGRSAFGCVTFPANKNVVAAFKASCERRGPRSVVESDNRATRASTSGSAWSASRLCTTGSPRSAASSLSREELSLLARARVPANGVEAPATTFGWSRRWRSSSRRHHQARRRCADRSQRRGEDALACASASASAAPHRWTPGSNRDHACSRRPPGHAGGTRPSPHASRCACECARPVATLGWALVFGVEHFSRRSARLQAAAELVPTTGEDHVLGAVLVDGLEHKTGRR